MPSGHLSRRSGRPRAVAGVCGLILSAALLLSGCTTGGTAGLNRDPGAVGTAKFGADGSHSSQGDDSTSGVTIASLRPKPSAALERYLSQHVDWKRCDGHFECGSVEVPIDWAHVTTASVRIALVKHPATGSRVGNLLVNPGGPGGSGVGFVEDGVGNVVDGTIEEHYDVIGFDPRGVGASAPVTCFGNAGIDEYLYGIFPGAIGSAEWIAAQKREADALAAACEKNTGPVLAHIDSVSVAEDMDVIRAALGDAKLNYLGYSYGTYLGTLYAGLFPDRVGRFVLDGADDPWGSDFSPSGGGETSSDASGGYGVSPAEDGAVAQTVGFEGDLDDYLRQCVDGDGDALAGQRCPFSGSLADAETDVERDFASVTAHPLVAKDGRLLGGATLATAIDESLYDPTDWPDLTRMFIELGKGNPSQAFEFADDYNDRKPGGGFYDNGDLANLAIGCLEDGHDVDLAFDRREATELVKVAPILGIYSAYGDLACSGWKYGPAPFPNPVHAKGSAPIVVVGTTGDPATPYSEAQQLSKLLDNGHLVTYHGEGHTAYDRGIGCINSAVDAYLMDGTVPFNDPQCH